MRFVFNERKAAEAAAYLLAKSGGTLPYIKLLKLLYLADRKALSDAGYPITGDVMVAMPHGPVLSNIFDRINLGKASGSRRTSPWFEHVSEPDGYDVTLRKAPPEEGELSDFERSVLDEIHAIFGRRDKWTLVRLTHRLPEWRDPEGSMFAIDPADILRAAGRSDEEIQRLTENANDVFTLHQALHRL